MGGVSGALSYAFTAPVNLSPAEFAQGFAGSVAGGALAGGIGAAGSFGYLGDIALNTGASIAGQVLESAINGKDLNANAVLAKAVVAGATSVLANVAAARLPGEEVATIFESGVLGGLGSEFSFDFLQNASEPGYFENSTPCPK